MMTAWNRDVLGLAPPPAHPPRGRLHAEGGAADTGLDSDDSAPGDVGSDDTAPDDTAVDPDGDGYTGDRGDCDDTNADVHPGAAERCNTVDDDCDSAVDEGDGVDAPTWYTDADGDGYGDEATAVTSFRTPRDRVAVGGDCVDGDATVHPDAAEPCDAVDDDSDTSVDEGFDVDADGHLDEVACAALGGDDCDDAAAAVHPGAVEVCGNGADDDCDDTAIGCGLAGDRARLLLREALDRPDAIRALLTEHLQPWTRMITDYIRAGQAEGRVRAELDPDAYVLQVVTAALGTIAIGDVTGALVASPPTLDAHIRELVRAARVALFNPRPE